MNWLLFIAGKGENTAGLQTGTKHSLKVKSKGIEYGGDLQWSDYYRVSIQGLYPLEEHLKANYVTTPHKGCRNPPNAALNLLFPLFGGWTATFLCGLTYPKIICAPEKEEGKRENGIIAWRRSSLFRGLGGRNRDVRVKHLVTQPGNAPKARPSHLTTADAINQVSPLKTAKASPSKDADPELHTAYESRG